MTGTKFWKSKKALATLAGLATSGAVLGVLTAVGVPAAWAAAIAGTIETAFLIYVLAQGYADQGKEATLVELQSADKLQTALMEHIEKLIPQFAAAFKTLNDKADALIEEQKDKDAPKAKEDTE